MGPFWLALLEFVLEPNRAALTVRMRATGNRAAPAIQQSTPRFPTRFGDREPGLIDPAYEPGIDEYRR
jgi:hypothetical protein